MLITGSGEYSAGTVVPLSGLIDAQGGLTLNGTTMAFTDMELGNGGAVGSPDGDRVPNIFEFLHGTDPLEANGAGAPIEFRLVAGALPGEFLPQFELTAAADRSGLLIELERIDLGGARPPTIIGIDVDPTPPPGKMVLTGKEAIPPEHGFYRLRLTLL